MGTEFLRRQPRFVNVSCDWHAQVAHVIIKRMNRRGAYVSRRYTLERYSPSAERLHAILRQYKGTYGRTATDNEPASRFCIPRV
jgi:hypothetical protein